MWSWTWLTPNSRGNIGVPHCSTEQPWPSSLPSGRTAEIAPSRFYVKSKPVISDNILILTWKNMWIFWKTEKRSMMNTFTAFFYRERFWENLTTPLFGTLTPPSDTTEVCSSFLHCYIDHVSNWNMSTQQWCFTRSLVFWRRVLSSWKSSAWRSTMLSGNFRIPNMIKVFPYYHLHLQTIAQNSCNYC